MQKTDVAKIRRKVILYISTVMAILFVIIIAASAYVRDSNLLQQEEFFSKQVNLGIKHALAHYIHDNAIHLHQLSTDEGVIELMKKKDYDALRILLFPKWHAMQKENNNLEAMQIHLSDGSSLLRMHKPEVYGDNLADVRPMLKEIHTLHKFMHGYETGAHKTVYRILEPVFDKEGVYIGAIEIGLNHRFILDAVHEITTFDGIALVQDNMLASGYKLESELPLNFHKMYASLENLKSLQTATAIQVDDKKYKIHKIGLLDYEGNKKIQIVFFQDISDFNDYRTYFLWILFAIFGLALMILIWLIYRRLGEYQDEVSAVYDKQIQSLQEAEDLLLQSQKLAHVGNWKFDFTTNKLLWSDEVYNIFELDKKSYTPTYEGLLTLIHPEDRTLLQKAFEDSLLNKVRFGMMHRFIMRDGSIKYLQEQCENFFDEKGKPLFSVGTVQDITETKSLENELRTSKQQFELFMKYIPAKIFIKDMEKKIVYANELGQKFFHKQRLEGLANEDLFNKEQAQKANKINNAILENGLIDTIEEFDDADGNPIVHRVMGFLMEDNGAKQIGMVIVDITQSYNDQQKLKEQEELMIAQSRHAAMGEMISMIAHQWRQPISVISMDANNILVDIELESVEPESLRENIADIISQTQHLSQTIDDFRDFFKPNKLKSEVLVEEVLLDAFKIIEKSFENNHIEVIKSFHSSTNVHIYARELLQVFINILKNAKEALMESEQEEKKIKISIYEKESFVVIEICDNAGGVDKSIMKSIFDPYFSTKDEKNGTGLGLYMSKIIVEKHLLGELRIANVEGGACFSVKIPKEGTDDK